MRAKGDDMQTITIEALDTLCFRDGKPFTSGEETWAATMFPPMPSVLYGALRATYFANQINTFEFANQSGVDPTEQLTIRAIVLQDQETLLFPMPLDCVIKKGTEKEPALVLKHLRKSDISNCSVANVLFPPNNNDIVENVTGGLLNDATLQQYLAGETKDLAYSKLNEYLVAEPKIGIGRENGTHTTAEGKLYRIDMRRLTPKMRFGQEENSSLTISVTFDHITLPDSEIMRLGGEGKSARYMTSASKTIEPPELTGKRFKLYLITPAIFGKGWLPNWIDEKTLEGTYHNIKVKLETAIIGKAIGLGGFDMEKRRPKEMRKAVPAGSVYYFELLEGTIDEAINIFHRQSVADGESYRKQGFGLTFIGGIA